MQQQLREVLNLSLELSLGIHLKSILLKITRLALTISGVSVTSKSRHYPLKMGFAA